LQVGSRSTHVVTLTNHSRAAADFSWACGPNGVFALSEQCGSLPALLSKPIVVTFAPSTAGNYYRRLVCLVRDADPVWVDVMGTAYSSVQVGVLHACCSCSMRSFTCCYIPPRARVFQRPFPLRQRHIDAYRLRNMEQRLLSPDELLPLARAQAAHSLETALAEAEWSLSRAPSASGDRCRSANAVFRELFAVGTALRPDLPVTLSEALLDWGAASCTRPPEKKVRVHVAVLETKTVKSPLPAQPPCPKI
jgi:hypothetical protein